MTVLNCRRWLNRWDWWLIPKARYVLLLPFWWSTQMLGHGEAVKGWWNQVKKLLALVIPKGKLVLFCKLCKIGSIEFLLSYRFEIYIKIRIQPYFFWDFYEFSYVILNFLGLFFNNSLISQEWLDRKIWKYYQNIFLLFRIFCSIQIFIIKYVNI